VVIAGAGVAELGGAGGVAQGPDRLRRRQPGQRLQHRADLAGGELVVAMPPGLLDREQAGAGEPGQLGAGGLRRDRGLGGEHAGGQRPSVAERHQDPGTGPVSEQAGHGGDVGVAPLGARGGHDPSMPRRYFHDRGTNQAA
jgi:hypothetical protein